MFTLGFHGDNTHNAFKLNTSLHLKLSSLSHNAVSLVFPAVSWYNKRKIHISSLMILWVKSLPLSHLISPSLLTTLAITDP